MWVLGSILGSMRGAFEGLTRALSGHHVNGDVNVASLPQIGSEQELSEFQSDLI